MRRQVSSQASYNTLDVSASVSETAINTPAATSQRVMVGTGDIWEPVPKTETNIEEATGKGGATELYQLGDTGKMSINITKMQPNDLALFAAYCLGSCSSVAVGAAGYEHTITESHEALEPGTRDIPTLTAVQGLGNLIDAKRIHSVGINSLSMSCTLGGWVTLTAEAISTGKTDSVFTAVSVVDAPDATMLTLPGAVAGSTAQERRNNVQWVEAIIHPPDGGTMCEITAVSDADPAVIAITSLSGTGANITYQVMYAPAPMPGWSTVENPQPRESALRVKDVCVIWGGSFNHETGVFSAGHQLNDVIKTLSWSASNGLTAEEKFCIQGVYEDRLYAARMLKDALTQSLTIDQEALSLLPEHYRKYGRYFAIKVTMTGAEFEAGVGYDVEIIWPRCAIMDSARTLDGKKIQWGSNVSVLYPLDHEESVIVKITNKWPQYAV